MEEILLKWGFQEYIPIFKENEINLNLFKSLTNEVLKDIIPKVGPRLLFLEKLKQFQSESQPSTSSSTPCPSSDSSFSIISIENDGDEIVLCNDSNIENNLISQSFDNASSKQLAFCGTEMLEKALCASYNLDLRSFLQSSRQGSYILSHYNQYKSLSVKTRNMLVDALMNSMMSSSLNKNVKIQRLDFEILSDKIVELFPTETKFTYYIPRSSLKGHKGAKQTNAKGKLIDKYRNLSRLYKLQNKNDLEENKESNVTTNHSDDCLKSAEWLKQWCHPMDMVLQKWKETFPMRFNSKAKTVAEFLVDWPILKQKYAESLINEDFSLLYPECRTNFFTYWNEFYNKLYNLNNKLLDKNGQLLLDLRNVDNITENARMAIEIMSLAYLIPPKGRVTYPESKPFKPTIAECHESIINHVKITGDVDTFITEKRKLYEKHKKQIQPYIIVVGVNISSIEECYLIVDDQIYFDESVSKLFDIYFKSFHVLHAQYPLESEHIWYIIQKAVYKLETPWDKKIPYALTILQDLMT